MLIYLYTGLFASLAVVYCEVLTAPGMVLGWWDRLLHKYVTAEWLLKPLGDCVYCFSGQLALWGYLLVMGKYYWLDHILFVGLTIFIVHLYCKLSEWKPK